MPRDLVYPLDPLEYIALSPQGLDAMYERYRTRNNLMTSNRSLDLAAKIATFLSGYEDQQFARKAGINPVVLRAVKEGYQPMGLISDEFLIKIIDALGLDNVGLSYFR